MNNSFKIIKNLFLVLVIFITSTVFSQEIKNYECQYFLEPVHNGTKILTNGDLTLEVMDPNAEHPYYAGQRFSPVAFVIRANYKGKEYLHNPVKTDSTANMEAGFAMEFDLGMRFPAPGYEEAKIGESYIKIGVGSFIKEYEDYSAKRFDPVVELPKTNVTWEKDRAIFIQEIKQPANGYRYYFKQVLEIKDNKAILHYYLKNTGSKTITTDQYVHNFIRFGKELLGPEYIVTVPYKIVPVARRNQPAPDSAPYPFIWNEKQITFEVPTDSFRSKMFRFRPEDGYRGANSIVIENTNSKQKLTIDCDLPVAHLGLWVTKEQLSPEINVFIELEPGEDIHFSRTYVFEDLL